MINPRITEMVDLLSEVCDLELQRKHMMDMLSKDINFSGGYGSLENIESAKKKFAEFFSEYLLIKKK